MKQSSIGDRALTKGIDRQVKWLWQLRDDGRHQTGGEIAISS